MKRIDVKTTPLEMSFTEKDLDELFGQKGYVLTGQVLLEDKPGIATRENPGLESDFYPVNVWVRHNGTMLTIRVLSALTEVIHTHGETPAIKDICQRIFNTTPQGILDMMESDDG